MAHNATFDVGFMNANYESISYQQFHNRLLILRICTRSLYLSISVMVWGLTKRFWCVDHHHMANYDAEATGPFVVYLHKDCV